MTRHLWWQLQTLGVYSLGVWAMVDRETRVAVLDLHLWRWNLRIGVNR